MSETIVMSGRIATIEDALNDVTAYEVVRNYQGWWLRAIGSDFSTLILEAEAERFCAALNDEEEAFQQRCLDEECGET